MFRENLRYSANSFERQSQTQVSTTENETSQSEVEHEMSRNKVGANAYMDKNFKGLKIPLKGRRYLNTHIDDKNESQSISRSATSIDSPSPTANVK